MSDYNSSLPIRTEANGDAAVKIVDGTITSQQLTVNADGSINITDNSGSITVDAINLDIRDLVFATDKVDVGGSVIALDATTLAALETITVVATDLDIRDLSHSQDSVKVGDGTDFLAINTDGSINVNLVDATPGVSIVDYNTVAAVAAGGTSVHTYTSVGNFYLTQIEASASGKMKIEVKVNAVTKFVGFNSTANPNITFSLTQTILATTGQTVTVTRTNKDNQALDVYSTILGYNG